MARAAAAEQKRLEKEAQTAHIELMQAQAEQLNAGLAAVYDEIDGLLAATLDVDDYVDLQKLRRTVDHPPFDRTDLEKPVPAPVPIPDPPEPIFNPPAPPSGLGGLFGKRKHAQAVAAAEAAHTEAVTQWQADLHDLPARRAAAADAHAEAESARLAALTAERTRYEEECAARESEVAEHNAAIDRLIANLGYGVVDAVEEYVSIVLSNSVYPEHFPIDHEFTFEPSTAELRLRTLMPAPDKIPSIKAYKYTKSSDEITTTELSQKARKDRYAAAVHQVALRSLHEVLEADRRGLIKSISLEVGTETTDPATGTDTYVPFVAVAADRDTFTNFDLSAVVPAATLQHLGASVSKNPFGLVAADTSGVRRS